MRFRDAREERKGKGPKEPKGPPLDPDEAGDRALRGGRGSQADGQRRKDRPPLLEKPEQQALAETLGTALTNAAFDPVLVRVFGDRRVKALVDGHAGEPVTIADCERASRVVADALTAAGTDPGLFEVEVSSPGADRPLTRPKDFARFLGKQVTLTLWEDREGRRNFTGELRERNDAGDVTLLVLDEKEPETFPAKGIREVRLHPEIIMPRRRRPGDE